MATFMAVSTFRDGVSPDDIREKIPAEQERAAELQSEGKLGDIKVAMPQRTVFIEVIAQDTAEATHIVASLPLASLWRTEFFETTPPAGA